VVAIGVLGIAPAPALAVSHGQAATGAKTITIGQAFRSLRRPPTGVAPAQASCAFNVTIQSAANHLMVAAEFGLERPADQVGMLRARTDPAAIGSWELFTVCTDGAGSWSIKSQQNGLWVSTELGLERPPDQIGILRARASVIGQWEQYSIQSNADGTISIRAFGNGRFVSTELGLERPPDQVGVLRARATAIGSWEEYV
jgi:hypothetical protein